MQILTPFVIKLDNSESPGLRDSNCCPGVTDFGRSRSIKEGLHIAQIVSEAPITSHDQFEVHGYI